MRIRVLVLLMILSASLIHWACVKGNPIAADQNAAATATPIYSWTPSNTFTATPTATSTPLASTITVLVVDGTAQSGVTVIANPPYGSPMTLETNSSGLGVFNVPVSGNWVLNVPTQGNFYQSAVTVNVTSTEETSSAVTFTTQGQALSLSTSNSESYGITGGNISYQVGYTQPGNLMEPIVLSIS